MLSHHLESALNDLKDLIKITESDIADIKEAKNDPQFDRLSLKEEKLKSFELFRNNVVNVDIVTFDEMFERTNLILGEFVSKFKK